jgi:hypothetical protein
MIIKAAKNVKMYESVAYLRRGGDIYHLLLCHLVRHLHLLNLLEQWKDRLSHPQIKYLKPMKKKE